MKLASDPSSSSCLSGQRFPPGFRFHPTDEELILYYLKRKICRRPLLLDVICETDVYKWNPEELPKLSKLKTGDRQWFFLSPRDRRYPNGARSNRATKQGFWKVTGKDRIITCGSRDVGVKKTLIFYKGQMGGRERTDWVMHEYTLDEEELKRCHSAQDYYALYKVFKKSGVGPKNGEQYGAPFREEDWADDDCLNLNLDIDQEKCTKQVTDAVLVESPRLNDPFECTVDDIEEILSLIEDEPPLEQQPSVDYSALVDHSSQNLNFPEQNAILHATSQHNVQANFDATECSTSQLRYPEAPEFTSAPVFHGLNPQMVEEDFLEDFLEVDDLVGPGPSVKDFNKPVEDFEIQYLDGLNEFDMYHDIVDVFLHDVGPSDPSQPYANNAVNGMVNPVSTNFSDNHQITNNEQLYLNEGNGTSGVVYDSISMKHHLKDEGTNSRFSSAIWDFLESIPTTPASATTENALVSMAFEHMSGLRVNARNMNNTSRSSGKSKSGFLCLYILGVLCAMLWVLLGTSLLRNGRCSIPS